MSEENESSENELGQDAQIEGEMEELRQNVVMHGWRSGYKRACVLL